jgi:hypothetical protein
VTGAVADNSLGNIVGVTVENFPWTPWAPYQHSSGAVPMWLRAYDMMEAVPGALPCISKRE